MKFDPLNYVAGAWRPSAGTGRIEVLDSTTGLPIAAMPEGDPSDVDEAARAARAAFEEWSSCPVSVRAKLVRAVAAALESRSARVEELFTRQAGMPTWLATACVETVLWFFNDAAEVAEHFDYEEPLGNTLIAREPIGVVGCITPWNYPLIQVATKVAYALAAGCTVVLKPSEVAPLDALVLAEVIDEVGFPPGVFNLVMGAGGVVGEAIASHPEVDMVSFTGSTRVGRRITQVAGETIKRVHLELGGKSANILLDDLSEEDFDRAVRQGILDCFVNAGQSCIAHSRMLVPRSRLAIAEAIACEEAETRFRPGDPFVEGVMLGPMASQAQVDRVLSYIERGITEGARVVTGGLFRPLHVGPGFYVTPTVFSEVTNQMTIAREEIFGPVLAIITYDDEDEAVAIANDSPYGLHGAVWSASDARALAVARRMRTGTVIVNGGANNHAAPFGGYRQSGNGREFGVHGFQEFLETKSIHR